MTKIYTETTSVTVIDKTQFKLTIKEKYAKIHIYTMSANVFHKLYIDSVLQTGEMGNIEEDGGFRRSGYAVKNLPGTIIKIETFMVKDTYDNAVLIGTANGTVDTEGCISFESSSKKLVINQKVEEAKRRG